MKTNRSWFFSGKVARLLHIAVLVVSLGWAVAGRAITYLGWVLQAQTDSLTTGLTTNWVVIPGSSVVTTTNVPLSETNQAVFYRLMYQP